jgi:hypothetical protein
MVTCMRFLLMSAVALSPASAPVMAQDRPEAGSLGKVLGYTILCDCVPGDPEWLMSVYFAIIENAYDRNLAEAMSGHMRVAVNSAWDNEMSICARVCGMEITQDLRELVSGIDGVVESPEFQEYAGSALQNGAEAEEEARPEPDPSWCAFKPFNPQCTR